MQKTKKGKKQRLKKKKIEGTKNFYFASEEKNKNPESRDKRDEMHKKQEPNPKGTKQVSESGWVWRELEIKM